MGKRYFSAFIIWIQTLLLYYFSAIIYCYLLCKHLSETYVNCKKKLLVSERKCSILQSSQAYSYILLCLGRVTKESNNKVSNITKLSCILLVLKNGQLLFLEVVKRYYVGIETNILILGVLKGYVAECNYQLLWIKSTYTCFRYNRKKICIFKKIEEFYMFNCLPCWLEFKGLLKLNFKIPNGIIIISYEFTLD